MKYLSSATVRFGASHKIAGCEGGHNYTVTVSFNREGFHETDLSEWLLADEKIVALAAELRNRSLNKMLGPKHPNVFGVAAFFMERLSILIPVTKVEVREDDGPTAITERDAEY